MTIQIHLPTLRCQVMRVKIIKNQTLIKYNRFFIFFLSFFVLEESPWNFEKASFG